jgi:hypothetical protein
VKAAVVLAPAVTFRVWTWVPRVTMALLAAAVEVKLTAAEVKSAPEAAMFVTMSLGALGGKGDLLGGVDVPGGVLEISAVENQVVHGGIAQRGGGGQGHGPGGVAEACAAADEIGGG